MRIYNPDDPSDRAATRDILRRIASALEITDLIALMMVFVTGLSAYATWRTAQVTNEILLTSQRPYVGIESLKFVNDTTPKIAVELRNFGSVQAEDAVIGITLEVNGKPLSSDSEPQQQQAPIVLSPAVPHTFYRHLTPGNYRDLMQGRSNLVVTVRVHYGGPRGNEHCYMARDSYDHFDGVFYPVGGSLSCDHQGP